MSGTPVLSSDFGAFVETVEHGRTGFRCRTLGEFHAAAQEVGHLDCKYISDRARRLYGLDAVAPLYEAWIRQLSTLYGDGWYSLEPFRGIMPADDLLDRRMPEASIRTEMVQGSPSAVATPW